MEAWLTPAVLWMIIGSLLMVLELALSVFVLLFIGAGAILTGVPAPDRHPKNRRERY